MRTRRYSTDPTIARWERSIDDLRARCRQDYESPTIADLVAAGIKIARWQCQRPGCYHATRSFPVGLYGRRALVRDLRRQYVCSACGTDRPHLDLLVE